MILLQRVSDAAVTLPLALMWLAIGVAAVLAVAGIVAIVLVEFGEVE